MRNKKQTLILKRIGLLFFKQRQLKMLSRTQLAIQLNTDEKQIRRIESGEVNCTMLTFLKLCYVLQLEPKELLDIKLNESILND
ncbi:MAG: helix-turn-helix transcriptional regulator [Bacteroidia bacterium]